MKTELRRRVTFALYLAGFVMNVVGFVAPFWLKANFAGYGHSQGLWRWCILWPVFSTCSKMSTQQEWFKWLQALESLSFALSLVSAVFLTCFRCFSLCKRRKVLLLAVVFCFASVLCAACGLIVFTVAMFLADDILFTVGSMSISFFTRDHVGWAFYLTCLGSSFMFASGLLFYDLVKRWNFTNCYDVM